jgi:hypothetical protein
MVCSPAPLAVGWADKARRHACTVKAPLSRVGTVRGCLDQARAGRRRSSVDSDGAEPERRLRDERGCREGVLGALFGEELNSEEPAPLRLAATVAHSAVHDA